MLKSYKFWLVFVVLAVGLVAMAQGCGSSTATTHTIYGTTS
jgi:hypothetical protein